ncbi:hypothetical protein EJF36_18815 [Bacillus sp. HMF5848]|uniref:hypothetical protein n=1 Tax=Bacillus sp. HMF5848 TaxID=2495421 RepID=UPI000F79A37A|nr:hypothetical protein [Bacillus sp. HMF5848]RSK28759.1 hypothetical protein EJF36_18815 [Bacillus sp. HMF5848]
MLETFMQQTMNLLKYSDIRLHTVENRAVRLEEKGRFTLFLEGDEVVTRSRIEDNITVQIMLFFTLLDAKIDTMYPRLEGCSLKHKYHSLPNDSDDNVIFSQVYRLLRILRNNAIHTMSSTTIEDNIIKSSGKYDRVHITKMGYELLASIVYYIMAPNKNENRNYRSAILRSYYDDLQTEILFQEDDINVNQLLPLSNAVRLKRSVRYKVTNTEFIVDQDSLTITRPYELTYKNEHNWAGVDYEIQYEGSTYVVPSEVLNLNGKLTISRENLESWALDH